MISHSHGGTTIEAVHELPPIPAQIENLFLDFETTSGNPRLDSLDPWHNCDIAGFAFTWDDMKASYYVPVKHVYGVCVPREPALKYLQQLVEAARCWRNHNVKYDAHVYQRHVAPLPPESQLSLVCTVVQSKLLDSDRGFGRGTYALDSLAKDWLARDISHYEAAIQPFLAPVYNKDYGRVPTDRLGEYACEDVLTDRLLDMRNEQLMPEECRRVYATENRLTRVLIEMETRGIRVDPQRLRAAELQTRAQMLILEELLAKSVGRVFNPVSRPDLFDIFCNQYGLPVLSYTNLDDDGNITDESHPSFDQDTLALYLEHPRAPRQLVAGIIQYRRWSTFRNLFVMPWQVLHVDGVLHPNHNQCVRTGRMSCSNPNTQQCNKDAKDLVLARDGYALVDVDASQLEYRWIINYIDNKRCIEAYEKYPDTDFHQHVADMCGIKRKPAKTVNFMVAFGGGKKKTQTELSINPDVVAEIKAKVDALVQAGHLEERHRAVEFQRLCERKGAQIYERYHDELPELKRTARHVEQVCRARGYVHDFYGRHRHLLPEHAHKAFNTINQASAADMGKERMVALYDATRGTGIELLLNVHDSVVLDVPREAMADPRTLQDVLDIMEHPNTPKPLKVPIRWNCGASYKTWAEAADDSKEISFQRNGHGRVNVHRVPHVPGRDHFRHLRVKSINFTSEQPEPDMTQDVA